MLDFLYNYGWIILLTIVAIVYFGLIYKKYGKNAALEELRKNLYKLMLLAQKKFGNDAGQMKFDWVVTKVYEAFPTSIKIFIDREDLLRFVQKTYNELTDFMDDGKINGSV